MDNPQQFPPCSYAENHKNQTVPISFMYVRNPNGVFANGTVTHEARAICAACMMKVWDAVLRPKPNQLLITLEREVS